MYIARHLPNRARHIPPLPVYSRRYRRASLRCWARRPARSAEPEA